MSNYTFPGSRQLIPFAFANIFIIWGSTFLAIAYGLKGFPPFMLSGFRFLAAGLLLFTWRIFFRGDAFPSASQWGRNTVVGALILTGGTGLVAWSEQYVSAPEAAIAVATTPFWFIALDRKNWSRYFSDRLILVGLITGFGGLLLFLRGSFLSDNAHGVSSLRSVAFVVLALSSIAWVLGSLFSKNRSSSSSTVMNSAQQLLAAGGISMLISLLSGEWKGFSFVRVPAEAWGGLVFLILFGSITAYLSYIWLLTKRPAALVSVHTYINPVVAVAIGWLFTREAISLAQLTGLLIILAGVLLTNSGQYRFSNRRRVKIRKQVRLAQHRLSMVFLLFVRKTKYS